MSQTLWNIKESVPRQRISPPASVPSFVSEVSILHLIPRDPPWCPPLWPPGYRGRIRTVSLAVPAGAQLLQACPDLICSPVCCLPRSPYQHFTFHHDFPGLNVCVFNYVDPGEFPFQGLRSNISSCDFLLHNLSFSLLSLWGQFLNCHWCSQILSPSDFICIFH